MARLNVTVDTDAKTISVTVDGEEIRQPGSVSVYAYQNSEEVADPHFEVTAYQKQGDALRVTRLCANDRGHLAGTAETDLSSFFMKAFGPR